MSCTDICSIIKQCGESGVTELKYAGFHALFGDKVELYEEKPILPIALQDEVVNNEVMDIDSEDYNPLEDDQLLNDTEAFEESHLREE